MQRRHRPGDATTNSAQRAMRITLPAQRGTKVGGAAHTARTDRSAQRKSPRLVWVLTTLMFVAALASPVSAHRLAPAYLEILEQDDGSARVLWKTSRLVSRGGQLEPLLPCPTLGETQRETQPTALLERWTMDCGDGDGGVSEEKFKSLVGQRVAVHGYPGSRTDLLLHIELADGRVIRTILNARRPEFIVPARERALDVATSYLRFGALHLLSGFDHLLFVLGLLALLGTGRALLLAITAFTLGHSLTLAIVVLGPLSLPQAPVEIGIAATLVLLAHEVQRPEVRTQTLLGRHPGLMPFAFGLLHGLGFAGALLELGLPEQAIPLALFAFNLGIELAQLALVALALPLLILLARWRRRRRHDGPRWLAELPATAIGSFGVYWMLARASDWLLR